LSEKRDILPPEASDVIFMGAIAAIFRGDLDSGLSNIASLAAEGYERAAGTQAQILAYQQRWDEAADYASQFLLNPASSSSHDMYLDMWRIVVLAALHTDDWWVAKDVVSRAKKIYANAIGKKRNPRLKYLNAFAKYITAGGAALQPYQVFPKTKISKAEASALLAGLERFHIERGADERAWPHVTRREQTSREDIYNAAMDYNLPEESIACFEYCQTAPDGYNQRLFLAKAFAMAGEKESAKQMVNLASDAYIPYDLADLLPISVWWDPDCRKIGPQIRLDKLLLRKRKTTIEGFHKIAIDKMAAISSHEEHLRLMSGQASFADIDRWEEQLSGDPHNLDLRALLLQCYLYRVHLYTNCADQHAKHVFWVIKNAPHTPLAGDALCMLIRPGQAAHYQQGKQLWLQALRNKKTNTQCVLNAANYLRWDASGQ